MAMLIKTCFSEKQRKKSHCLLLTYELYRTTYDDRLISLPHVTVAPSVGDSLQHGMYWFNLSFYARERKPIKEFRLSRRLGQRDSYF